MIEHLAFTVRFPPTDHYPMGRHFDRNIDFTTGMTGIVGPNEVGKSLCLEMIEFLLFGNKALRGAVSDYKHLKAHGSVLIRGKRYRIERTAKNALLGDGVDPVAVGTKPVNARILQILGYGLEVFRVANVANQGDAERLSKMLPTERKAMVDKLIGADQVEAIGAWCAEQALGLSREIAGLEAGLGAEPVKPEKPEGYRPADELREEITTLRSLQDTITRGDAFLANEPVVPEVGEAPTLLSLETLTKADQVLGLRTYDFDLNEAELAAAAMSRWEARQRFVERYFPCPTLTAQEIEEQTRRVGLMQDRARLRQTPEILCPCGKPFTTADAEIARLEAEIDAIPVLKGVYNLAEEAAALKRWTPEVLAQWKELENVQPAAELVHDPREAKGAVHIDEVRKALAELGVSTMSRAEIQALAGELRAYQAVCAARDGCAARHAEWELSARATRTAVSLARKAFSADRLMQTEQLLSAVTICDAQLATYQRSFLDWAQGRDRLTDLRRELASWRNGKQAMNDLRADTKTYLVPALSRVASHMLSQMTGGARGRIAVDEDFEIQVDGQPLNTLSGSGKVCANLAVRLGLGRILTNGVFPVFMGDEMDAFHGRRPGWSPPRRALRPGGQAHPDPGHHPQASRLRAGHHAGELTWSSSDCRRWDCACAARPRHHQRTTSAAPRGSRRRPRPAGRPTWWPRSRWASRGRPGPVPPSAWRASATRPARTRWSAAPRRTAGPSSTAGPAGCPPDTGRTSPWGRCDVPDDIPCPRLPVPGPDGLLRLRPAYRRLPLRGRRPAAAPDRPRAVPPEPLRRCR